MPKNKIQVTGPKNINRAERVAWAKITSVEPTKVWNARGNVVCSQCPVTDLTGNCPPQAVAGLPISNSTEEPHAWRWQDWGMR